jgi:hypothetical protein
MLLRWQSKPRFDASWPASGRLPARSGRSDINLQYPPKVELKIFRFL